MSEQEWEDAGRVTEYLSREIPHRDTAEQMLLEALPERVERFVDLGTGDGRLIALLHERYPRAEALGLDFSAPMLERAAQRFSENPQVQLRRCDLALPLATHPPVDAVVSGLAVHHLEHARKQELFEELRAMLPPGGTFANLDLVSAQTPQEHERFRRAIGRPQDDPADRLAGLCEQLDWLRSAGFEEVDCHFKWLQLVLIVAR